MRVRILLFLIVLFFYCYKSTAQSIYAGGSGSGFSISCYAQANNLALDIYQGGLANSFSITCYVQPHSPLIEIYKGGIANSASVTCYSQISNTAFDIYSGGNANSFSTFCYTQADNGMLDIYKGGTANSFSFLCYTQQENGLLNIYKGGNSNSFSILCYTQLENAFLQLYMGGNGDGFTMSCYTQSNNLFYEIYKGGSADGFAYTCAGSWGAEIPLPIELLSFTGQCKNEKVLLKWTTASEIDNAYFVVERSPNTINWEVVERINGAGNSSSIRYYSITDAKPFDGVMYFRLKQEDTDGDSEYFDIIAVDNCKENKTGFSIYPNPATGVFNIAFNEDIETVRSLQVFNALGKIIRSFDGYQQQIDLSTEEDGVYFVKLRTDSKITTQKIILAK